MKHTTSLKLTNTQLFWHYSIVLFILTGPVIATIDAYKYFISHTYSGIRPIEDMLFVGYLLLIPAIIAFIIQKRRLKFKRLHVYVDEKVFLQAAKQTAKELNWKIVKQTNEIFVAKSFFSWRSWGELITIVRDDEGILINSICDPDNITSVASYGMNKKNRDTFERILEDCN